MRRESVAFGSPDAHFALLADCVGDARPRLALERMIRQAGGHRWGIAVRALELEDEIVRQLSRSFHRIPEASVRDAYAEAWERACRPVGQTGAFPQDDLQGLAGWLHRSTAQRLLHVARDAAKWRAESPAALEGRFARGTDPAEIVQRRDALARVAAELSAQPDEVRAYFLADRVDGLKREEIRRQTGWSQDKIKHLRRRTAMFLERAAPVAIPPTALGRSIAEAASRAKAHLYGLLGLCAPAAEGTLGTGSNTLLGARIAAAGCATALVAGTSLCGPPAPAASHHRRDRSPTPARHAAAAPRKPVGGQRLASVPNAAPSTPAPQVVVSGAVAAAASRSRRPARLQLPASQPARSVAAHATNAAEDFAVPTFESPSAPASPGSSALRAPDQPPTATATAAAPTSAGKPGDFAASGFESGGP